MAPSGSAADSAALAAAVKKALRSRAPASLIASPRASFVADHHQPVGAGFRAPDFAATAEQLTDAGVPMRAREAFEFSRIGIEAYDRVSGEIAQPDLVVIVDIHRVATGVAVGQRPDFPILGIRVVTADLAGGPEARPDHPFGIRPDPARINAGLRRWHHRGVTADGVNPGDVI